MAYAPAGNTTQSANLTHLATVYYKKRGLDVLKKRLRFASVSEPDAIPLRVGPTVQWYRYTLPGANTSPSSDGVVGTSQALATSTISATVSQYSDFYSLSTFLQETAIDPIVENTVEMASYRAALSVDTIMRTEFDTNNGSTILLNTLGAALSAADFRRTRALLNGIDVHEGPRGQSDFVAIAHPYALYDLMSDNSAGGFIDVNKYSRPETLINQAEEGTIAGTRLISTTNVTTSGTAPNVLYYTYVVGKGAVGMVELSGSGPSQVEDPDKQAFKTNVVKGGPNTADPEGNIGSFVSYRYVMVAKTLDTTNVRLRIIKADASLV